MATKKNFNLSKLNPSTKIFVIIAIIIGAALIFGGVPQTAKFMAATAPSTAGYCSGTHTTCNTIYYDQNKYGTCESHTGCSIQCYEGLTYAFTYGIAGKDCICTGTPHSCSSFTTKEQCTSHEEWNAGCRWTSPKYSLTAQKTGTGTVSSNPLGINCGATCSYSFDEKTSVTLQATPSSGYTFAGWSGACSGTATTCTVNMASAQTVTATFNPLYKLTTIKAGTSTGTITSSPAGINCGSDCSEDYVSGTSVTLTAAPSTGTFGGWSGACSGTATTCTISIDAAKSVTATFNAPLANGAACTANNQCSSGYCLSGKCAATTTIPCGSTTCNGATQKCCTSVNKCYAKTAACPM